MQELLNLRNKLDQIDAEIVELLDRRFQVTQLVGHIKKANDLPAEDKSRESQQFEKFQKLCQDKNLNIELIEKVFTLIIEEVKDNHRKIREGK